MPGFSIEPAKFEQMFDFHSAAVDPMGRADGAVVFGRNDRRLAEFALWLMKPPERISYAVITGGKGKDSGNLDVPEAVFVANAIASMGVSGRIFLETNATNGAENARFSLDIIQSEELPHRTLTAVAHATSLRRLALGLATEVNTRGSDFTVRTINRYPTNYPFDPTLPSDQTEAAAEMLRLADWPTKFNEDGTAWLLADPELERPDIQDLVEYAREFTRADLA